MTEIISNHRNIDSRLQERNSTTVAHDVWSDSALSQRGSVLCRESNVLSQQIGNTVAREWRSLGIPEKKIVRSFYAQDPTQG
jgi:hypothetical protein